MSAKVTRAGIPPILATIPNKGACQRVTVRVPGVLTTDDSLWLGTCGALNGSIKQYGPVVVDYDAICNRCC